MPSPDLLVVAMRVLEDPESSPALKTVAVEALTTAIRDGLTIPARAPLLLWRTMVGSSGIQYFGGSYLGQVAGEDVRGEVLAVLADPKAGLNARQLAAHVLTGTSCASGVTEEDLVMVTECARHDDVDDVARAAEAILKVTKVSVSAVVGIRDRWAASPFPSIRAAAVRIECARVDVDFVWIGAMLDDPSAEVREAVAFRLDELPMNTAVLGMIDTRLRIETAGSVRVALLRAQARIIEMMQWEMKRRAIKGEP